MARRVLATAHYDAYPQTLIAMPDAAFNRALGSILASAAGDALGAPYEFLPPIPDTRPVAFMSGGAWSRGEWTDDTAMSIPILDSVAAEHDLLDDAVQGRIVRRWLDWSEGAKDVGIQTRAVFKRVVVRAETVYGDIDAVPDTKLAMLARDAAAGVHRDRGRSGGNGSLMRTAPVALAYLADDEEREMVRAARAISELTHFDPEAGDACVLWCAAIRRAIRCEDPDVSLGLALLAPERRELWKARLDETAGRRSKDFKNNGWVVAALQASVASIAIGTDVESTLVEAVRAGYDTDTVAAITGQLAGAIYGASTVPMEWVEALHGWPDVTERWLRSQVIKIVERG